MMADMKQSILLGLGLQELTLLSRNLASHNIGPSSFLKLFTGRGWSQRSRFQPCRKSFRRTLVEKGFSVGLPAIDKKFVSVDGTVRYLMTFDDGESVETFWMPEGDAVKRRW